MGVTGHRLISLSAVLALVGSSHAQTIFNSFGPNDSYSTSGWTFGIDDGVLRSFRKIGAQFTATGSGLLSTIEFGSYTFVDGLLRVELFSDSDGILGTVLEDFTVTAAPRPSRRILRAESLSPSVGIVKGAKYWVVLSAADADARANFNWNSLGLTGRLYGSVVDSSRNDFGYFDDYTMPAFRVNVVPEPASMAALGLGALALVRKRRKNA